MDRADGGYRMVAQRRILSVESDREEISRGVAEGEQSREIAARIGRYDGGR